MHMRPARQEDIVPGAIIYITDDNGIRRRKIVEHGFIPMDISKCHVKAPEISKATKKHQNHGINSYWSTNDEIKELKRYPISTLRRMLEYAYPRRTDWTGLDKKKILEFARQRLSGKSL